MPRDDEKISEAEVAKNHLSCVLLFLMLIGAFFMGIRCEQERTESHINLNDVFIKDIDRLNKRINDLERRIESLEIRNPQ